MISYKDLINGDGGIQEQLNNALASTTQGGTFEYAVNGVIPNTAFEFNISSDSGEYKQAEKGRYVVNGVPWATYFFNGNARYSPVSLEGEQASAYNAVMSATIDLLIPVSRLITGEQTDNFISEIRRLVDETLGASASKYITSDNVIYLVGTRYSLMQTGQRELRDQAGDSIVMTLYLTFYVVASGIQSSAVELTIDNERIIPSKVGFSRKTTSEAGVPATSTNAASKVIPSGSAFVINFDTPAKLGTFNQKLSSFVFAGTNTPMTVTVKYPQIFTTVEGETVVSTQSYTYSMIFDNDGINTEQGYAVSASVTLVEVM